MYARFETLLEELGCQIEFIPEGEETQEDTKEFTAGLDGDSIYFQYRQPDTGAQRRSRRPSINPTYTGESEDTGRLRSRASMSQLETTQQFILEPRSASRATTRKSERTATNVTSTRPRITQPRRGGLIENEFANILQHHRKRPRSRSSQGNPHSRQGLRAQLGIEEHLGGNEVEGDYASASEGEDHSKGNSPIFQPLQLEHTLASSERLYTLSRTRLLKDADIFQNYRIESLARDLVDKWCYAAVQAKEQHKNMERLASARDAETLLRQAFEHWRRSMISKKQIDHWERFWDDVSQRISAAKSDLLLRKMFRKWRQLAYGNVLRNREARQYILSVKYFQAWHNIAITNQRKILYHGLQKFFEIWKQRYIRSLTLDIKADLVRQASLLRNVYWDWFWAFCGKRAPEWRDQRLRRKCFISWINVHRNRIAQCQCISVQRENNARTRIFWQWLGSARVIVSAQREAALFNHQKLIARALPAWRQDAKYSPLARQISNMVDWRVARTTFTTLSTRFAFEKQADYINRSRIVRNQWTCWNDRLRYQSLSYSIDERCLREAVLRWINACRASIILRLWEQKLQRKCLSRLLQEFRSRRAQREANCRFVQETRNLSCLQVQIRHWRSRREYHLQAEQAAFEFHKPKLVHDILQTWVQYLAYRRNLDTAAKDAGYYFVKKRLIKCWHVSSIESKKQKRRNAYVLVRRSLKRRLAARIIQHWHNRTEHARNMRLEANAIDERQLFKLGTNMFDVWKAQFVIKRDQHLEATQYYDRRSAEQCLYTWIERLEDQAKLEETAELNNELHVSNLAFSWLHKLRLRTIEQKGREANAKNLGDWYERRHFHNILRRWQDQTFNARNQAQGTPALSSRISRIRKPIPNEHGEGLISRTEDPRELDVVDWTPSVKAQTNSTPLAGYLSTPSKRAARAKALIRDSTTPVGSPFENRLGSQLTSTPRTVQGRRFGRSVSALRFGTSGAAVEDAPRTPGV